jgi:hypothetical protein
MVEGRTIKQKELTATTVLAILSPYYVKKRSRNIHMKTPVGNVKVPRKQRDMQNMYVDAVLFMLTGAAHSSKGRSACAPPRRSVSVQRSCSVIGASASFVRRY